MKNLFTIVSISGILICFSLSSCHFPQVNDNPASFKSINVRPLFRCPGSTSIFFDWSLSGDYSSMTIDIKLPSGSLRQIYIDSNGSGNKSIDISEYIDNSVNTEEFEIIVKANTKFKQFVVTPEPDVRSFIIRTIKPDTEIKLIATKVENSEDGRFLLEIPAETWDSGIYISKINIEDSCNGAKYIIQKGPATPEPIILEAANGYNKRLDIPLQAIGVYTIIPSPNCDKKITELNLNVGLFCDPE